MPFLQHAPIARRRSGSSESAHRARPVDDIARAQAQWASLDCER